MSRMRNLDYLFLLRPILSMKLLISLKFHAGEVRLRKRFKRHFSLSFILAAIFCHESELSEECNFLCEGFPPKSIALIAGHFT